MILPQKKGKNTLNPDKNTSKKQVKKSVKKQTKKPTQNPSKNNQKSQYKNSTNPVIARGLGAWLVYSELQYKNSKNTAPKLNKKPVFSGDNYHEIESNFNDYLDYENITVSDLETSRKGIYRLQKTMRDKAPLLHKVGSCNCHRVRSDRGVMITVDSKERVNVGNVARCKDPFCAYCNDYDGEVLLQKAITVQTTHNANNGTGLLLSLTAPHSHRTRIKPFMDSMQKAYQIYHKQALQVLEVVGLRGSLKRNEYAYSVKNGHHYHIHVAYGIDDIGDNADALVAELQSILSDIWFKALLLVGLVKKTTPKDNVLTLLKSDRSFEYVAKKHKSGFSGNDYLMIENKSKDFTVTIFELAELVRVGKFDSDKFMSIYQELLIAWHGTNTMKYSRGFLDSLGLMIDIEPKPTKQPSKQGKESHTEPQKAVLVPSGVEIPQQANNTPHKPTKPKKRYINDIPKELTTIAEIHWFTWLEMVKNDEHLIFIGMIQKAVTKGYIQLE